MDLNKLTAASFDVLPDEIKPIVAELLSGRIRSMAVVFETVDGNVGDAWFLDVDGADNSNRYTLLGAIEGLKRDYMRAEIESRVEYRPVFFDDDGEEEN